MKNLYAFGLGAVAVLCAANVSAMQLTKDQLDKGVKQYIKEIPQCVALQVTRDQQVGRAWFYELKGNATIEIVARLGDSSVDSIEVVSSAKNDGAMRDMMCVTVALMRGIQPEYITVDEAIKDAAHLWENAAQKPFKKAFFFDTFTAKLTPLSLVVQ
ncbi:hypothetical protein [Paracandidimonas soli]|uniref:Uncharacterized protein n=1 Tax=Paracandidimonas soli TaxID=1917182 RepID=A0A4R3UQ41_9BURK|nr:hypothetical protein [Paracandidimonas soli]TCU93935.1 hypothetical protein EV686_110103 [Paracandidimonas soli]